MQKRRLQRGDSGELALIKTKKAIRHHNIHLEFVYLMPLTQFFHLELSSERISKRSLIHSYNSCESYADMGIHSDCDKQK